MRRLFLIIMGFNYLTIFFNLAYATNAPDTLWRKNFINVNGYSFYQTKDGGYIISGMDSMNARLIKTDANGNKQWDKLLNSSNFTVSSGNSVQQTSDNGYIVTGYKWYYGGTGGTCKDVWLIKTDATGNKQWEQTYGSTVHDIGYCVDQTLDGGYMIVGCYSDKIWLIKTGATGNKQWDKTFKTSNIYNYGRSGQQTKDKGYIITGSGGGDGVSTSEWDIWLIKTDSLGDTVWTKFFGETQGDYGYCVKQTLDDGYIIVGANGSYGTAWIIKTDSSGNELWDKTYGGAYTNDCRSVQETTDGGYVVFGDLLVKTDSLGNIKWNRASGTSQYGTGVQQSTDGGYIMLTSPSRSKEDKNLSTTGCYLVKTSPLWLIFPDSSKNLVGGSVQNITWQWEGTANLHHFRILFSFDGGVNYSDTIANNIPKGDTSYSWKLPFTNCSYCRIKIQAIDSLNNVLIEDASDQNFTIEFYTTIAHPSVDDWIGGSTHSIVWYTLGTGFKSYKLLFSSNGGISYPDTVAKNVPIGDTSYLWKVPFINSSQCHIKIQMFDSSNKLIFENAGSTFYIDFHITLNSPWGGQCWTGGSTHPITWSKTGVSFGSYRLLLSKNGGVSYLDTIAKNISPDSVSYSWTLPDVDCSICRVKAQILDSMNNFLCEDASDTNFIIDSSPPPIVEMISPIDSTYTCDSMIVFCWHKVTDLSGINYYTIQYAFDSLFSEGDSAVNCSDTALWWKLTKDSVYYWHVKAIDKAGHIGEWSEIWNLKVDPHPIQITNTTIWHDTSFQGPFPVYSTIASHNGIDSVKLYYKINYAYWVSIPMDTTGTLNQYLAEIPSQSAPNTIIRYYIYSRDTFQPANEAKAPANAPGTSYSFTAGYVGTEEFNKIPKTFFVSYCQPNPSIDLTKFEYGIPIDANVIIAIYNRSGRKVATLVNGTKKAGYYSVKWNQKDNGNKKLAAGVYFMKFKAGNYNATKKLILIE
ncbi:MAG: T9SS type A sorting domain-containing protein [bacterium]